MAETSVRSCRAVRMTSATRRWLTVFFQIATRQSAPKVTPTSGRNASTTLREDNEDLKRRLCEAETVLAKTMDSLEEVRGKYRKLLHSDGGKKERQLRQEILALETFVRYWPIHAKGRLGKYSRNFNGPSSGSGSAPVATVSRLLRELLSPTLDALAMGQHPLDVGVIRGSEVKRVGEDILVTAFMKMREKKLSSRKDDHVSQQVREHLHI